ncbi:hypothetical protein BC936DRAFT_148096 [Jimgerdemannia flammicorona]|uniref:Uncharacterized protein n=1 Tax=Jimgerdemannia flammicorona TaxID=994334 RepID=A0A433DKS2_9FUNG|nr:hypothetical protein BC936DRAFT_148096 [Jimgerdemannia flammicorona]
MGIATNSISLATPKKLLIAYLQHENETSWPSSIAPSLRSPLRCWRKHMPVGQMECWRKNIATTRT